MDRQSTRTLNVQHIIFSFLLMLTGSSVSHADNATPGAFVLATPHQSTYILEKYGAQVGEITNQLTYTNNEISYLSVATATGVASLFFSESISEKSVMSWPQNQTASNSASGSPQLQGYYYSNPAKQRKNQQITLNWLADGSATITVEYRKKTTTMNTHKSVWSRQLLPIIISSHLQQNPDLQQSTLSIIEKDGLDSYTYNRLVTENIEFQDTLYPGIKFEIKKPGSNRVSYVWLAAAFDYLPLKIEQFKDGELDARMLLTDYKRTQ